MAAPLTPLTPITVALDWTPNANHAGFYLASARGLYAARGLAVGFRLPDEDAYALAPAKAVLQGAADFAVAPSETAIAYATGGPEARLVAVAALLQTDTSAIAALAASGVARPRDLDGKTYASYAARFELATVKAMVRADGGRGELTEVVPPRLACFDEVLAGRADATWIFSPHEGVLAAEKGVALAAFRPTDFGVPYGYSPVLLAAPATLAARPADVRAFLAATAEGFRLAAADADAAADALRAESRHASLADAAFVRASVRAAAPAFLNAAGAWGEMEPARWSAFIDFLAAEGLLTADRSGAPVAPEHLPTAARVATNDFLPAQ
jgi:ABC-type nitrate/sulfonate/bicarbonate transport system substrate-binding protein